MTGKHWVEAWKAAQHEARLDEPGPPMWTKGDVTLRCDGAVELRIVDKRGEVRPIEVARVGDLITVTVED